MKWIDEFKIALVNENTNKIEELVNNYPDEMNLEELQCCVALLKTAHQLYIDKQKALNIEFEKIKKVKKYNL